MRQNIRFVPDNISVSVETGDNILSAAAAAGVYIPASCGGEGVCGKCRVQIEAGEVQSASTANLSEEDCLKGIRLACTSKALSNLVIRIPETVRADGKALKCRPKATSPISAKSLTALVGTWNTAPPIRKILLHLPPPDLDDNISDMQRLMRGIKHALPGHPEPYYDHPELLRELPFLLREAGWQVTVILLHGKRQDEPDTIIAVEASDTTDRLYGLACDIGTTTVCGALIDLNTGEIIAEASGYNAQIVYGADIISRIIYSLRDGGLKALQAKVVATLNTVIEDLCRKVTISPSDISYIMTAGNTVMAHLLLGISPKFIREAPYVPSLSLFPLTKAAALGIMAHPSVRIYLYPCVSSYVGGDIVAGIHACQMHRSKDLSLFIDIGTNGEIVVGNSEWLICAACSAGPAFEGGGIRFGMRASPGAIENCHIHPETLEPMIITIGNTLPKGICGSGLIAVVSELLATGIIDQRGKFSRDLAHPRVRRSGDGWEYVLVWSHDSLTGEDITITEIDLDNLIRAKGALFAGYQTLLASVGLTFSDLDRVILAGNFGAHIDLERAISIGLLPDLDRSRFFYLGNASLLGCRISLTDHRRFQERTEVRELMTNMELSENPDFMDYYIAALFLPHTDMGLFPSAGKAREDLAQQ
ncbi:MAG: ASKHA domain-containing protein [Desulfoprunum sp.]|nr:ASKHA domain-containing protein [Desulfoprunum sp.]